MIQLKKIISWLAYSCSCMLLMLFSEAKEYISSPCPQIQFIAPEKISLDQSEIRFLCGDPAVEEYEIIPLTQAKFHAKAMLQHRGYHLEKNQIKNQKLTITTGDKIKVRELEVIPGKYRFTIHHYNFPFKQVLTPQLLNQIEQWVTIKLKNKGFACPQVELIANAKEGKVFIYITEANTKILNKIELDPDKEIFPEILTRYFAFKMPSLYNEKLIELTTRRMTSDGVVISSYFDTSCHGPNVELIQHAYYGKPRVFTVGIGANTEVGPLVKTTWKNSRFTKMAHTLSANLYASFKEQLIQFQTKYYPFKNTPRFYLDSSLDNRRQVEDRFDRISTKIRIAPSTTYDNNLFRFELSAGPSYTLSKDKVNFVEKSFAYPSFDIHLSLISHDYEYYKLSPQEGLYLDLATAFISEVFDAPATVYQTSFQGSYLSNIGDYYPARLILGLRWKFTLSTGPQKEVERQNIPLEFRNFLGGARDVRGFDRNSLPSSPLGAMTSLYTGAEARTYFIKPSIQPLIFIDLAKLGVSYLELDQPLYWSPGAGLRYESPIGAFRLSIARGMISKNYPKPESKFVNWQWYLSFGQEF